MSIIGARPHFMKMAPLSRCFLKTQNIEHVVVHSGQHYDAALSDQFIEEFKLKKPNYNLEIGSASPIVQIGRFLIKIDPILAQEKPDIILVYGDTNTTAAGAIAAAKNNIPLGHVEAGLREWDKSIPEEINKLLTDAVTDLYFCPTKSAVENLRQIGVEKQVFLTGDITLDLLVHSSEYPSLKTLKANYGPIENDYIFFTCHRQNNTNVEAALAEIVAFLNESTCQIIWPIHPRTQKALETFQFKITNSNVSILPSIKYWETQSFIRNASFVVTDSGGITKEAYFHKKQCVVIDVQTEWMSGYHEGWTKITGPNKEAIQQALSTPFSQHMHTQAYGNGHAAEQIKNQILRFLS